MRIDNPSDEEKALRLFKYLRDLHQLGSANRTNSGNQVLWIDGLPENNTYVECNIWKEIWSEDDRPWIKLKKPPVTNPSFPVFTEAQTFQDKLERASEETIRMFRAFSKFTEAPKLEDLFACSAGDKISADIGTLSQDDPTIPAASMSCWNGPLPATPAEGNSF